MLALGLTACGPPEIETGELSDTEAQACTDLVADLPDRLLGEEQVEVEGDTAYGAAWGDPAIVLTCGVGAIDITEVPECIEYGGVGWLIPLDEKDGDVDVTFTADGQRPRVQLLVPDDYLPEGAVEALTDLGPAMKRHTDLENRCLASG